MKFLGHKFHSNDVIKVIFMSCVAQLHQCHVKVKNYVG